MLSFTFGPESVDRQLFFDMQIYDSLELHDAVVQRCKSDRGEFPIQREGFEGWRLFAIYSYILGAGDH